MLRLALPVVVAELGWTAMATVDTLMAGRLSPEAIGAVSLGSGIFLGVTMFGMGLLLGLDTLIAQAFGAGKLEDCHRSLLHGIYAALALTIPFDGEPLARHPGASRVRDQPGRSRAHDPLFATGGVELAAAASLRGYSAIPAGYGTCGDGDGRLGDCEHRERANSILGFELFANASGSHDELAPLTACIERTAGLGGETAEGVFSSEARAMNT